MNFELIKLKIFSSEDLSVKETTFIFDLIMNGKLSEIEISGILIALKIKSESKNEILGAAQCMRDKSIKINSNLNTVDTCGTGGDMSGTLNISTGAAIVAASAGASIAKHGNRSISSKSGSADMLEKLGYKITNNIKNLESSLEKKNFCFLFAQYHHSAMKHVINVRKKLKTRTIFNLLGPLTNPANTKNQLLGVYDKKWVKIHCEVLKALGSKNAMVVHGEDGLDEISPYANTNVVQLKDGKISEILINPKELNIGANKFDDLLGDDAKFNASKMIEIFNGEDNDFSKAVCLNAAAGLIVAEKYLIFNNAYDEARKHILSGKAYEHLKIIQNV